MQIRDALVAVHHGQIRPRRQRRLKRCFSGRPLVRWHACHRIQDSAQSIPHVGPSSPQFVGMRCKDVRKEDFDRRPEDDRIADFHHRCLHVQREQHAFRLRVRDLFGQERFELAHVHDRRIDDFTFLQGNRRLQNLAFPAISRYKFDPGCGGAAQGGGGFRAIEVAFRHAGDVGLAVLRPSPHPMWVLASVGFDRFRGTAVAVALPQYRVDC